MVNRILFIFGIIALFGSIIVGVGNLFLHMLTVNISTIILVALSFLISVTAIVYDFMTAGVAEEFAKARMTGNPIAIVLRNDKSVKFRSGKIQNGIAEPKGMGKFIITPDSVYNMPNGTTGYIAYYKYGNNLHPNFVRLTTRLREMGITDINQLNKINEKIKNAKSDSEVDEILDSIKNEKKYDLKVNLDANQPK